MQTSSHVDQAQTPDFHINQIFYGDCGLTRATQEVNNRRGTQDLLDPISTKLHLKQSS